MRKFFVWLCAEFLLVINFGFLAITTAFASGQEVPAAAYSAYDLIYAVNSVRTAQGISAYKINSF